MGITQRRRERRGRREREKKRKFVLLEVLAAEIVEADVVEGVFGAGADEFVGIGEGELFEQGHCIGCGHAEGAEAQGSIRAKVSIGIIKAGDEQWEDVFGSQL